MPRKNQEDILTTEQEDVQEEDLEQHELIIEDPDDIAEKQSKKKTLGARAKELAEGIVILQPDSKAKTPKRKTFQKMANSLAIIIVDLIDKSFPDWSEPFEVIPGDIRKLSPTNKQIKNILVPLGRIADRHVGIEVDNPDIEDGGKAIGALLLYMYELRINYKLYKMLLEQQKDATKNVSAQPAEAEVINLDSFLRN